MVAGREQGLQVGDLSVVLEGLQGRVVPAVLEHRLAVGRHLVEPALVHDARRPLGAQAHERIEAVLRHHDQHDALRRAVSPGNRYWLGTGAAIGVTSFFRMASAWASASAKRTAAGNSAKARTSSRQR